MTWIDDALLLLAGLAAGVPLGSYLDRALFPRPAPPEPAPIQSGGLLAFEQVAQVVPLAPVAPRRFVRLTWRRYSRAQWRALWSTTAMAELAGDGKPFSRAEVEAVRDLLIRRGVASWKNPAARSQGWVISEPMRRAIVAYCGAVPHRRGMDG